MPPKNDDERRDGAHGDPPTRYRTYDKLLWEDDAAPGLGQRDHDDELYLASTGEPSSSRRLNVMCVSWRAVMKEETRRARS